MSKLVFLCGARDFHAMDWYRSALKVVKDHEVCILTDLIGGEGFDIIMNENDKVYNMFILDKFLFRKQSALGNIWRNIFKLIVVPIQVKKIRKFVKNNPDSFFFAHGMYYLYMAQKAGVKYIGTPQGSEILVRPFKSKRYKSFAQQALDGAQVVTVDSEKMREQMAKLFKITPTIVQNGISMTEILKVDKLNKVRDKFLSIRGFTPLYREQLLIDSRNCSKDFANISLTFVYPFFEQAYFDRAKTCLMPEDKLLGRLNRCELYQILAESKVVFSIPESDSSPRSVYEAIFMGCVIIASYHKYIDNLPQCMHERIVVVNLGDTNWFDKGMKQAMSIAEKNFEPTKEAIDLFDQEKSFQIIYSLYKSVQNKI